MEYLEVPVTLAVREIVIMNLPFRVARVAQEPVAIMAGLAPMVWDTEEVQVDPPACPVAAAAQEVQAVPGLRTAFFAAPLAVMSFREVLEQLVERERQDPPVRQGLMVQ